MIFGGLLLTAFTGSILINWWVRRRLQHPSARNRRKQIQWQIRQSQRRIDAIGYETRRDMLAEFYRQRPGQ